MTPVFHMDAGLYPSCCTSDPALCEWPVKQQRMASATYTDDLNETPGCCVWPVPAPVIVGIWGTYIPADGTCRSLFAFSPLSL